MTEDDVTTSDDGRDEQLAARLAVPPLDEVTRRRLVRTAADAALPAQTSGTSRQSRRWVAIASAAALMLGGVAAVGLALDGGNGETPTAARTTTSVPADSAPEGSKRAADTDADAPAASIPATATALPDLGDVTDPATLAAQARARDGDVGAGTEEEVVPCEAELTAGGLRGLRLIGEGTQAGERVYVLIAFDPETDATSAVTVMPSSCLVRTKVPL